MINYIEKQHPVHGKCLFLDNGVVEVGVPLSFGLRICHFSFVGEGNVFYEHPADADFFTTPDGWRLRGGHRLWLAPESAEDYAPDNAPILCKKVENGVEITQNEDPLQRVVKQMRIVLEGACVRVSHTVVNTAEAERSCALWAISVMAPGGVETVQLAVREGGYDPLHHFTIWDHSSLGDPRASYFKDKIVLTWQNVDRRYKLGVGHPVWPVRYENGDTVFVKHCELQKDRAYPDGGMSFETFLSNYMVEVESLSPLYTLKPGERATHDEVWTLLRAGKKE